MGARWSAERGAWAGLDRLGDVEIYEYSAPEDVAERAAGAACWSPTRPRSGPTLIDGSPDLRFITLTATGFDCVDVAAARRRGIPVSNVPVYGTDSVAQFVFALLLELCHHVALHDAAVRAGEWTRQPDFSTAEDAADRAGRQDDGDRRLRPDRPSRGRARPCVRHGR